MTKQNQSDRPDSDRPDKDSNSQDNLNSIVKRTKQEFKRLALIQDPVEFVLEFDAARKSLKINQGPFQKAWKAWQGQQRGGQQ